MHNRQSSARGTLLIISAPSGAGKTSLVAALLQRMPGLSLSISHTTRSPRPGEVDGQHYHFVADAQFQDLVARGDLLEYAQVFDYFYGTSRTEVMAQLEKGADVILEIDWQGARLVRAALPEARTIFILPPSREELEQRLRARKQDTDAVIQRRLRDAVSDMRHFQEYEYCVINADFESAVQDLVSIVRSCRLQTAQVAGRDQVLLAGLLAGAGDPA